MGDTAKSRIAKLRKRLVISRNVYIEAVERQEHRAFAHRTDPRRRAEFRRELSKIKNRCLAESRQEPEPTRTVENIGEPDPAVYDTPEQIQQDEALIAFYLADTPDEPRRPNARGNTHEELLRYWLSSKEARMWQKETYEILKPRMDEIKKRILSVDD